MIVFVVLFVWGTFFGSFLNVLIDRFSTDRSVVKGRSYCEDCKKTLGALELIPLVSFIVQKGKCKHCSANIPPRLFLVELLIGILLPLLYFYSLSVSLSPTSIILLGIILYCFIGIFFADIEYGLIPDKFILFILVSIIFYLILGNFSITNHIISALGAFIFFFALFLLTKGRGMGFGDVKLSFVLGLFLGFPLIILCLYIAFLTGAIISIILVIWRKVSFHRGTIPFGPFLIFSAVVCFFFGNSVLLPIILKFI